MRVWLQQRVEERGYIFCVWVYFGVTEKRAYTEQTWNQTASRPEGCRYSGSECSQTPPPSWSRSRACGRCWSGRRPPGSTHRAAGRQSAGWSREG